MPGLQNFDYDIYTTPKLFEGVIATNDATRAICCFNNETVDPLYYGRMVRINFQNRAMIKLNGSGQFGGILAYKHSHEVLRDENNNPYLAVGESGDVYKTGSFVVRSLTPVNASDDVYVVDDPASADNGRFGDSTIAGGVLVPGARFETTLTAPGNVVLYIENIG